MALVGMILSLVVLMVLFLLVGMLLDLTWLDVGSIIGLQIGSGMS